MRSNRERNLRPMSNSAGIIVKEVAVDMGDTSIHFEWASITTKNILPAMGPAKSMWSLDHGLVGHVQGCSGADGGRG